MRWVASASRIRREAGARRAASCVNICRWRTCNGEGKVKEISVERHALALLFDFEEARGDYVTCPVGRLRAQRRRGRFEMDAGLRAAEPRACRRAVN